MHIYTKRITDISWDDVEAFCNSKVTESAYLDYKRDFPTDLAKTVSAMANTFGGVVIIGVDEDDRSAPVVPITGIPMERGLEERVINTMVDSVSPPIIPDVAVCVRPDGSRAVLVIRIAESPDGPHAMQANTRVYIRTGKRSSPEELANLDRIRWLTGRRQRSEEFREQLLERASQRFVHLRDGLVPDTPKTDEKDWGSGNQQPGLLTIALTPMYPDGTMTTPRSLEALIPNIRVSDRVHTADVFPLPVATLRLVQDGIVSHLSGQQGLRTYHTLINVHGLYFFKQSLLYTVPPQHRVEQPKPHTFLRAYELVARLYAMAESGHKLYDALGYRGALKFLCRIDGLLGLPFMVAVVRNGHLSNYPRYSADSDVVSSVSIRADDLADDAHAVVCRLLQPITWAFDWDIQERELRELYGYLQSH